MEYAASQAVTQWIEDERTYPSVVSDYVLDDRFNNAPARSGQCARPAGSVNTENVAVLDTAHSWYAAGLKQISALSVLQKDWHDQEADPPNSTAVTLSQVILSKLSDFGFRPDRIDPSSAGGICISFEGDDKYADIECLNSGNIIALTMEGDDNPSVWDLKPFEIPNAIADIDGFISG